MSGIFIEPNEEIVIDVYVAISDSGEVFADTDKAEVLRDYEGKPENLMAHSVKFRRPDYKAEVAIYSDIIKSNSSGVAEQSLQLDLAGVTYKRFVNLIKSWTFKNEAGEILPPTQENIDKLHPAVARAITSELSNYV